MNIKEKNKLYRVYLKKGDKRSKIRYYQQKNALKLQKPTTTMSCLKILKTLRMIFGKTWDQSLIPKRKDVVII